MNIEKETEKLNKKFLEVCEKGDINMVVELYNKYYLEHNNFKTKILKRFNLYKPKLPILDIHYENNLPILHAFDYGHFQIVNYLLKEKQFFLSLNQDENEFIRVVSRMLNSAFLRDQFDLIKLFIPMIKNKNDIFYNNIMDGVIGFKSELNLDIIKYLLKQPDIDNQKLELYQDEFNTISSYTLRSKLFKHACLSNQTELLKFLTSSEIKNRININNLKEIIYIKGKDVINYIILDLNISQEKFKELFRNFDTQEKQYVDSIFEKRELHKDLNIEIPIKSNEVSKVKRIKV